MFVVSQIQYVTMEIIIAHDKQHKSGQKFYPLVSDVESCLGPSFAAPVFFPILCSHGLSRCVFVEVCGSELIVFLIKGIARHLFELTQTFERRKFFYL